MMNTAVNETLHESAEHFSVFGLETLTSLEIKSTALMVLLIIMSAIAIEKAFEVLKVYADGTSFFELLPAAEKQLMVAGITAFVFKVYINSTPNTNSNTIHSLEFADTLVPIFSFLTCLVGFWLILYSIKVCDNWSKASHASSAELLNSFHSRYFRYIPSCLSAATSRVEFKMFHHIFCQKYQFKLTSFPFDEYMELQFEKFILDSIEISPASWCLFGVLLFLQYFRQSVYPNIYICKETEDCNVIRYSNGFMVTCVLMIGSTTVLLIMSRFYEAKILAMRGILSHDFFRDYILYAEKNLKREVLSLTATSLMDEEKRLKDFVATMTRNGKNQFKTTSRESLSPKKVYPVDLESNSYATEDVANMDISERARKDSEESSSMGLLIDRVNDTVRNRTIFGRIAKRFQSLTTKYKKRPSHHKFVQRPQSSMEFSMRSTNENDSSKEIEQPSIATLHSNVYFTPVSQKRKQLNQQTDSIHQQHQSHKELRTSDTMPSDSSSAMLMMNDSSNRSQKQQQIECGSPTARQRRLISQAQHQEEDSHMPLMNSNKSSPLAEGMNEDMMVTVKKSPKRVLRRSYVTGNFEMLLGSDSNNSAEEENFKLFEQLKDCDENVFWFSSPGLYFALMKLQLMNITFHISIYLVEMLPTHSLNWQTKFMAIVLIMIAFFIYLIAAKSTIILKAMDALDTQSLLEVIEQTEGARNLEKEIRDAVLEFMNTVPVSDDVTVKQKLMRIFNTIDSDNSGYLCRNELGSFLDSLNIHFSKRKWKQVFRHMDRNQECANRITFDEFYLFIFPQDPEAIRAEQDRLKQERENERMKALTMQQYSDTKQKTPTLSILQHRSSFFVTSALTRIRGNSKSSNNSLTGEFDSEEVTTLRDNNNTNNNTSNKVESTTPDIIHNV
mmetsp:Transcript_8952/g.12245  ORF Transcript_8952/g.12245 Transcript_8952/m.12245 type:complete len:898 (+) Transcript_8952:81-2774(+)